MTAPIAFDGFPYPGDWIADAHCRGLNPDVFFPERSAGWGSCAEAKAICSGCPVIVDCRDYAVANPALRGVWGGLSVRERAEVRREAAAA